ncbi:MAG: 3-phosphoshikimate 1-carboxyvinyltransferase [Proteobacteria bacterium]|nr:3-phosphoshikimate 1-carboxyvinyltransferase [Pseudomonadota bacterium]
MKVQPAKYLKGEVKIPGDKSITHRAIIFSSLSDGKCNIENMGLGQDNISTINVFRNMGVRINRVKDKCVVDGVGIHGLKEPINILDAGNSGTTIRIVSGILSAQSFFSVITGDKYLVKRPMKRIVEPLSMMGAYIIGREKNSFPPLAILGNSKLKGINYNLTVASAQVKSSILMAGMYADSETTISEPVKSRDHTERIMKYLNIPIKVEGTTVKIDPVNKIPSFNLKVPGDISSASFFIVAGTLLKDSMITIKNVSLNETRTGIIDVLLSMGANIKLENVREECGEPVGDIIVKGVEYLKPFEIRGEIIPRLIDEIPILSIAGAFADGISIIDDAHELRVKESDRIKSMLEGLKILGVKVEELPAGMIIHGTRNFKSGKVNTFGDHRIAMSFFVFGLCSNLGVELDDVSSVKISFPDFFNRMESLINA